MMLRHKYLILTVLIGLTSFCFGQSNDSKWRFGSTISGGYAFYSGNIANDFNSFGSCTWDLDFYYGRIHFSPYCQAGWGTLKIEGSKYNLFDFGLRAGYNIFDGEVVQVTPLLGIGILSYGRDSGPKNIATPSVGANLDFRLWENEKSRRKDIWMIRLRYACLFPLNNGCIGTIHNITLGFAVKGVLQ